MSYHLPDDEDDVIALLKHSDRVRRVGLIIWSSQWESGRGDAGTISGAKTS